MGQKLDITSIGAYSMGTKRFWTKTFGQNSIGPSWPRTKMFWMQSIWLNVIYDINWPYSYYGDVSWPEGKKKSLKKCVNLG